jgi:hypothetical protein
MIFELYLKNKAEMSILDLKMKAPNLAAGTVVAGMRE